MLSSANEDHGHLVAALTPAFLIGRACLLELTRGHAPNEKRNDNY